MTTVIDPQAALDGRPPARRGALLRFVRNPLGVISAVILLVIVLGALLAPWITPNDPAFADLDQVNSAPNAGYLLGGDGSGRDILSRLLAGARLTLLAGLIVAVVALVLGLSGGLLAGYVGRWVDSSLNFVTDVIMALPAMILLVALFAVFGPNVSIAMAAFGILVSPFIYRLVRTVVRGVRNELYVDAARVSGLSDTRIVTRHVLAAVRAPLIIVGASTVGAGIAIQAGLEFLGLGDPSSPTWGGMLNDAFLNIYSAPLNVVWPGLAIGLTIGSLSLLANALRDALEDTAPVRTRTEEKRLATQAIRTSRVPDSSAPTVPDRDLLVSVSGLRIGYPDGRGGEKIVVSDVDLSIARGEIVGLVGESGSGKSQTAFAILGLLPPTARILDGSVQVAGREMTTIADRDLLALRGTTIAYVPQEPMSNLDPSFTVGHQLVTPMRRRLGLSRADATSRALDLLDRVGIADPKRTFGSYAHQISGGMAQRVLIAGAISCDPELIVADEPTTALDVTVQAEVLDLLRDLQKERGMGMLLVTHNFGVVADICDRVSVMQQGQIVETGQVDELFARPRHPYSRTLLGSTLESRPPRVERDGGVAR
ncbi:dipeptide/oligopeptide/nickel ABC transporter permease/ATP-binding protein [Rathayibacter sp. VKM Ac-2754]|uniref:dipeptide/oligopeptide/nickel ABC transporter permease/ATP-binding protein n=1 Tax=Rathayibacter sp. VKM Ac-2754 TaxID=2609251 RepID=UPI0013576B9A|nr:dipeptide/oligopeptide/nickel ABC transporter permease/ATP-binding protein [Rathayibacter sp. VKM Ac-2754]MWV60767.1 ATP-binding cassette domain-containing protein [Rathayibacter sp. VKM Ac-2754]